MKKQFPEIDAYRRISWHDESRVVRNGDLKNGFMKCSGQMRMFPRTG